MSRMQPIGIRLSDAEREALERAAAEVGASLSTLARNVLADWLRQAGWLEQPALPVRRKDLPVKRKRGAK